MARAKKPSSWMDKAKSAFWLSVVGATVLAFLYVFGSIFWFGAAQALEWRSFEKRAVPATGQIVGRYIETCVYGPCKRYPPNWGVPVASPDLAASKQFDADFCINRKADGSPRPRRYFGPGPCFHVIVTRHALADGQWQMHQEAATPLYYWETWEKATLPLLVDPANPQDARHPDNRYHRDVADLAFYMLCFLGPYALWEWLRARYWAPWRKKVVKREKDRLRRQAARKAKQNALPLTPATEGKSL